MSHIPGQWKFEVADETDKWVGYHECGQDLQMTISKDDTALIATAPEMLAVGMSAPICPHCGQADEENIWLARQQDEEYDDIFFLLAVYNL